MLYNVVITVSKIILIILCFVFCAVVSLHKSQWQKKDLGIYFHPFPKNNPIHLSLIHIYSYNEFYNVVCLEILSLKKKKEFQCDSEAVYDQFYTS